MKTLEHYEKEQKTKKRQGAKRRAVIIMKTLGNSEKEQKTKKRQGAKRRYQEVTPHTTTLLQLQVVYEVRDYIAEDDWQHTTPPKEASFQG